MQTLTIVVLVAVVINIILTLLKKTEASVDIDKLITPLKAELDRLSLVIKNDNSNNKNEINNLLSAVKNELNQSLKDNRTELNDSLEKFRLTIESKMTAFSETLKGSSEGILNKQEEIRKETESKLTTFQATLNDSLKTLNDGLQAKLNEFGAQQKADAEATISRQEEIRKETETKLTTFQTTLNDSLKVLNDSLQARLNEFGVQQKTDASATISKQEEIRKETETKLFTFQATLNDSLKTLDESLQTKLNEFGVQQKTDAGATISKQEEIRKETETKLEEMRKNISKSIEELTTNMKTELSNQVNVQNTNSEATLKKQTEIRQETEKKLNEFNKSMNDSVDSLSQSMAKKLSEFGDIQKTNSEDYIKKHDDIKNATDLKLEAIRKTVQDKLEALQDANTKKLDEMRQTVDEKLQQTLNTRLTESFKQVSDQLDKVHIGLGSMTSLANDVGGLKKALTNVKTRGMIGEIQLESLLSSVLSPDQYESNVQIKKNSQQRVEFAIKLPGREEDLTPLYLPIDSKFPDASYQKLLLAYEDADTPRINQARKELENAIKLSAKDINEKYIDPPATTDWGILFLPFEGLYAEVLQNSNLVRYLQTEYHVTLAGPTTLGAFINSLQMGFKTLAIQKRSSEVWQLLGAVKTQFQMFGNVLDAAQKKIRGAGDDIEKLVGTRTRMIQSKLRQVELLPGPEANNIIDIEDQTDEDVDSNE
ncbi:MAG: DNA recombination protein RmuC [Candidatus Cloacimonetes bacterium]|nr:DNA recombination protein RmuC [Candidatus Cloacimonadota bacterium]